MFPYGFRMFFSFIFVVLFVFFNWKGQRTEVIISDHDFNNSSGNSTTWINLLLPMWCKGENWGEDGRSGQLWPQPGADVEADHVDNQPTKGQPWPRPQPKPGAGHLRCGGQGLDSNPNHGQPDVHNLRCGGQPWPRHSQVPPWRPSNYPSLREAVKNVLADFVR